MPLDPGAQAVLDLIKAVGRPPLDSLPPPEARAAYAASRNVLQPPPQEVAEVRALRCDTVPLRLYRPAGSTPGAVLPCLMYLHGGGWVIGDLESHDQLCRTLANYSGGCVVAVDYRLAPEHKFPAAVEDAAAALRYLVAEAAALGIDPARIAVGGDSAGGNLAAVLGLMARDGAVPMPALQMLLYPVTDMTRVQPSYQRITEGYPLVAKTMGYFIEHYLRDGRDELDWRASPLRAASLAGAPPGFVLTVGHDPLCDEGMRYAQRLDEEGGHVTHLHIADQMHGFLTMGRLIPAADTALRHAAAALAGAWARG